MSVVDQRVSRATGAVRRLLLRAVLVLGGAFAVTVIGWLCCSASANADVLPPVPNVPSVLSAVSADVTAVAPKQVDTLSTPDLVAVGKQAHAVVTDIGERVAPTVRPAADLVTHTDLVPIATQVAEVGTPHVTQHSAPKRAAVTKAAAHPSAHRAARVSPVRSRPRQPFLAVARHRHVSSQSTAPVRRSAGSTSSPVGADHHSPALPPLQPTGSFDANAHGGGSVTGGAGGAHVRSTHVIGDGLIMAASSSTPRIAAGPGRQPGTSPD